MEGSLVEKLKAALAKKVGKQIHEKIQSAMLKMLQKEFDLHKEG